MTKGIQSNIRLNPEVHAILESIAEDSNISFSALTTKILTDYVQFYYYKIERGDITVSQPILRKFIESIDSSSINEIAQYNAKFIISEMKSQEGEVTYDEFVRRSLKWNKGNHLLFNKIEKEESDVFVSKHSLGQRWSELQCKTYGFAFELIGQTVVEQAYDSDNSFSLEVVNHSRE